MNVVGSIVRRNLRLFFRDRMNVFFSLLGAIILFVLYTLFLARLQIDGLSDTFPDATEAQIRAFVDTWMFAGIVMLSTITTGLGALATLVDDGESGRFRDFLVSPIARWQLVLGYLTAAVIVAVVMSMIVLVISILYLGIVDGTWLSATTIVQIAGITVLCCAGFTALSALVVSFIRTNAAFSGFATVIGTVLGFVAGAYIPVGSLPVAVASTINALPFAQGAMLLRREFTAGTLAEMVGTNADAAQAIREFYGIDAYIGDLIVPASIAFGVLLAMAVGFTLLSAGRIRARIR
ncbi:ABC transporter permease [Microbacterium pygmaeum]|uniref:Multidrug/hemolysin transport system permease protein n=1 Tax=Microbacterium pygmaeum TaxID=370764 RepID=A0A1G8BUW4_9MICO|nr:ABC transporter permease [Microbacterium pygmaeum]SDH36995.1 multidrug/hemolysin transport system permease protein [Microbacterium pygmaeum]